MRSAFKNSGTIVLAAAIFPVVFSGCARKVPRFTDGAVVRVVDDNADIPEPQKHPFLRQSHHFNNFISRQARLGLDPMPPSPARDVNRLGEVPNSSWYENRTASLSAAQVVEDPGGDDRGPEAFKPWKITGLKIGGRNPGFVFEDTRGARYICKFDKQGAPAIATAAGAVAARLFWACGYHVPDDRVIFFSRHELLIEDGATAEKEGGEEIPITHEHIDEILRSLPTKTNDGRYRALASRFLVGRPVGGFSYRGTRDDDPNDIIPHQDRRSLRGLRVFGAWLNHVDMKIDNTLDLYVEENRQRYIRHYLVDFDGCLGGFWAARREKRIGFAFDLDLGELFTGIPTLGLITRPYENLEGPQHPHVGLFESREFDPTDWRPNYQNDYVQSCRPADGFWAGNILGLITDEKIDAVVQVARYDDPQATALLAQILKDRRDKTLDWALTLVTPVIRMEEMSPTANGFTINAQNALRIFGRPSRLLFEIEFLSAQGQLLAIGEQDASEPAVFVPSSLLKNHDYLVVRWTALQQNGKRLPPSEGHYLKSAAGWRLAGVLRDGE